MSRVGRRVTRFWMLVISALFILVLVNTGIGASELEDEGALGMISDEQDEVVAFGEPVEEDSAVDKSGGVLGVENVGASLASTFSLDSIKVSAQPLPAFNIEITIPANSGEKVYTFVSPTEDFCVQMGDGVRCNTHGYGEGYTIFDENGGDLYSIGGGVSALDYYVGANGETYHKYTTVAYNKDEGGGSTYVGERFYIVFEDSSESQTFAIGVGGSLFYDNLGGYVVDDYLTAEGLAVSAYSNLANTFHKTGENVSSDIAGSSGTVWDVWTLERSWNVDIASENDAHSVLSSFEFLLIAEYNAYFANYSYTNSWGGLIGFSMLFSEPYNDARLSSVVKEGEKASWMRDYASTYATKPGLVGGKMTLSVDIYVPVGSELVLDEQGIIRDRSSYTPPTPTVMPDLTPTPQPVSTNISLRDEKTAVSVSGTLEAGTILDVTSIQSGMQMFDIVESALSADNEKFVAYDINLLNNNHVLIQPSGAVRVILPIPDGYEHSRLVVYKVAEDGALTTFAYIIDVTTNTVMFETDSFSIYVVAETKKAISDTTTDAGKSEPTDKTHNTIPKTGESETIGGAYLAFISLVAGVVMAGIFASRRRKAESKQV